MTDFEKWIYLMKHGIKTEHEKLEESYKRTVKAYNAAKEREEVFIGQSDDWSIHSSDVPKLDFEINKTDDDRIKMEFNLDNEEA